MSVEISERKSMARGRRVISPVAIAVATLLVLNTGTDAFAQTTTASLSPEVVKPGTATTVTVVGTPGYHFAIVGSTTGAGFSYSGVQFAVGPDLQILVMGVIDGTGRAVVSIAPPFLGTSLDRYYIQAVTSPNSSFAPLEVAPGNVLVNADLKGLAAAGLAGPAGPQGPGRNEWRQRHGGPDGSCRCERR